MCSNTGLNLKKHLCAAPASSANVSVGVDSSEDVKQNVTGHFWGVVLKDTEDMLTNLDADEFVETGRGLLSCKTSRTRSVFQNSNNNNTDWIKFGL